MTEGSKNKEKNRCNQVAGFTANYPKLMSMKQKNFCDSLDNNCELVQSLTMIIGR